MHTRSYLLAFLAPSIICAPLPAPPKPTSQLPTRQPIGASSSSSSSSSITFNPNLKAAITNKRARVRETSTADALAEEKRAYELEVSRGSAGSVVLEGRRGARGTAAADDDIPDAGFEAVVE